MQGWDSGPKRLQKLKLYFTVALRDFFLQNSLLVESFGLSQLLKSGEIPSGCS